jgi:hypothetical protein
MTGGETQPLKRVRMSSVTEVELDLVAREVVELVDLVEVGSTFATCDAEARDS